MKTYPEMADEYIRSEILKSWDDFSSSSASEEDEHRQTNMATLIYDVFFEDDYFVFVLKGNERECVLANLEYVIDALVEKNIDPSEAGRFFLEKDWGMLDFYARQKAVDDVCGEIARWFLKRKDSIQHAQK